MRFRPRTLSLLCCILGIGGCGNSPQFGSLTSETNAVIGRAAGGGVVEWSSSFSPGFEQKVMRQANVLAALPGGDPEFMNLTARMGSQPPSSPNRLVNWWRARTHYVVKTTDVGLVRARLLADGEGYAEIAAAPGEVFQDVAVNLSADYFVQGKARSLVAQVTLPVWGAITIASPRTGIIALRPETVAAWMGPAGDGLEGAALIWGTLLHEARHGDGTGDALGLLHTICPDGLGEFSGKPLCDRYSNGPYGIQLALYQWVARYLNAPSDAFLFRYRQLQRQASPMRSPWIPRSGGREFETLAIR